jgi:diguanylate cyclase (GGDEF)-like protein
MSDDSREGGPRQLRTRISLGRKLDVDKNSLVPTLQVVEGPGVGRLHRFPNDTATALTVGRTSEAQFVIDDASVSRCHARFSWLMMGADFLMLLEDLQSTNGCRVNGEKVDRQYLKQGDLVALGDVLLRFQMLSPLELSERDRLIQRATAADVDPLTGLGTRLYMEEALPRLLSECESRGFALSVLVIDLDHFKRVNDTLGHPVGDRVLAATAGVVLKSIRESDVGVRFGGEEFIVLLPGTALTEAGVVGERVRSAIAALDTASIAPGIAITVSIGVAQRRAVETFAQLFERADQALYRAKKAGRDRVEIDRVDPSPAAAC